MTPAAGGAGPGEVKVTPVPCLADNYAYLFEQDEQIIVVDPSEPEPVLKALAGRRLTAIACTHHHWDHVGGVEALVARFGVPVYASAYDHARDRVPGQTVGLRDGETVSFGALTARVWLVPGHTLGALAWQVGDELFTGDTLFLGGCGRLFEGDAEMMLASLSRLRALSPETRLWCGHEYTARNRAFGRTIAPDPLPDPAGPSMPGTLAEERRRNVLLRWDDPAVMAWAGSRDPVEVFGKVRGARDMF